MPASDSDVDFWFCIASPMDECKNPEILMENNMSLISFERPAVIERIASNMGKRKSSTPQKFVGKHLLSFP